MESSQHTRVGSYCFLIAKSHSPPCLSVVLNSVLATWYFLFPNSLPPTGHPVLASLRRACTTSFGSVVLASFVNAIVKAIRWTFQLMSRWMMSEETSCITVAVVCIVECLLRFVEQLVLYVNQYALSYIAIYGKRSVVAQWIPQCIALGV